MIDFLQQKSSNQGQVYNDQRIKIDKKTWKNYSRKISALTWPPVVEKVVFFRLLKKRSTYFILIRYSPSDLRKSSKIVGQINLGNLYKISVFELALVPPPSILSYCLYSLYALYMLQKAASLLLLLLLYNARSENKFVSYKNK